jgi:hypothetical protein
MRLLTRIIHDGTFFGGNVFCPDGLALFYPKRRANREILV